MTVWETMQTSSNPKEGVVFIRGEWKGDQMRGVISQQLEGGTTRDFNFTTSGKVAIPPTTEKEKKEEPKPAGETKAEDDAASAEEEGPEEKPAAPESKKGKGLLGFVKKQ